MTVFAPYHLHEDGTQVCPRCLISKTEFGRQLEGGIGGRAWFCTNPECEAKVDAETMLPEWKPILIHDEPAHKTRNGLPLPLNVSEDTPQLESQDALEAKAQMGQRLEGGSQDSSLGTGWSQPPETAIEEANTGSPPLPNPPHGP